MKHAALSFYCIGMLLLAGCKTPSANNTDAGMIKSSATDSDENKFLKCSKEGYSRVVLVAIVKATNVPKLAIMPDENAPNARGYNFANCHQDNTSAGKFVCEPEVDSGLKTPVEFIYTRESDAWTSYGMPCVSLN